MSRSDMVAYMWVPSQPTAEDLSYLQRIFSEFGGDAIVRPLNYEDEIAAILAVNKAVTKCAPHRQAIDLGCPREPKDLYEQRRGICFDLSRSIEKGLRSIGFQVRHVSAFSREHGLSRLYGILLPSRTKPEEKQLPNFVDSHALCEVHTSQGWLAVDSLSKWLSLDDQGDPISLRRLQREVAVGKLSVLDKGQAALTPKVLRRPFFMVYGLYSRHGRFYPPYLPFPNINFSEFLANFAVDN
jgi:hypothetical protein